jgi:methylamine--corrinoid protein Co-methyltransferase
MECLFGVEMGKAAAGFTRQKANELVNRLLQKYEPQIETAPAGSRYQECYDITTGKPGKEYLRLYDEVKEELTKMGVSFE